MLRGDEDDVPARRVQAIQPVTVLPNLKRCTVPNSVVLDREPALGESGIRPGYQAAAVMDAILHLGTQPVQREVHPHLRLGPRFGSRVSQLERTAGLDDPPVATPDQVQLHLPLADEPRPQGGIQIGHCVGQGSVQ